MSKTKPFFNKCGGDPSAQFSTCSVLFCIMSMHIGTMKTNMAATVLGFTTNYLWSMSPSGLLVGFTVVATNLCKNTCSSLNIWVSVVNQIILTSIHKTRNTVNSSTALRFCTQSCWWHIMCWPAAKISFKTALLIPSLHFAVMIFYTGKKREHPTDKLDWRSTGK